VATPRAAQRPPAAAIFTPTAPTQTAPRAAPARRACPCLAFARPCHNAGCRSRRARILGRAGVAVACGGAALAFGLAAAWVLRRKKPESEADEVEPQRPVTTDASPPATLRQAAPADLPARSPVARAPSAPASATRPRKDELLAVAFTARRLSATLVNTALTYELVITNTGGEALGPIAVNGDMIGAHASLPPRFQLEAAAQGEPITGSPGSSPAKARR